jgi:hypothetical protein
MKMVNAPISLPQRSPKLPLSLNEIEFDWLHGDRLSLAERSEIGL